MAATKIAAGTNSPARRPSSDRVTATVTRASVPRPSAPCARLEGLPSPTIVPVRTGNVPASTPARDQPMPLSMLETTTATPKIPVRAAVNISSARRDIIYASSRRRLDLLDQPALFARDLLRAIEILLNEGIERIAGQECIHLRGLIDV